MNPKIERLVAILLVISLCIGSYILKVRVNETMPRFDPQDPTAFYWTESALQYHYAELVATSKKIPDFDPMLQAPEGVYIKKNLTLLLEYTCGYSYRLLGLNKIAYPFHLFTIRFIAAFSVLMVLGMFMLARKTGLSEIAAALAAGLCAFSLSSVSRSVGGFLHEDVALPFFIVALAFFFSGIKSKRALLRGFASGIFFALSLASWHFSRFLFLTFAVGAAFGFIVFTRNFEERLSFARTLEGIFAPVLIASFAVTVLFEKRFFISSPVFLMMGTILGFELFKLRAAKAQIFSLRERSTQLILIAAAILWLLGFILERIFGDTEGYEHVWSLFVAKIRYLNIKPDEPDLLPYPARSLWIEDFNIPSLSGAIFHLFPIGIFSIWGFLLWIRRKDVRSQLISLWGLMYGVLFIMVQRLRVLFVPFWVIWASGLEFSPKLKRIGAWAALFVFLIFHAHESFSLHHPTLFRQAVRAIFGTEKTAIVHNWQVNDIQLTRWIHTNTKPDGTFLSRFSVGPLILAYGNRATALQPKFEVEGIKEKVHEFEQAYYSPSEQRFYELCQRWSISYFVHDIMLSLDSSDDSSRWVAGSFWLPKDSVAFMFQFAPDRLKHFELVYQNSFYRVFRVLKPDETPSNQEFGPQPVFDIKFFGNQSTTGEVFNDAFTPEVIARMDKSVEMATAAQELLNVNPRKSLELCIKGYEVYPGTPGLLAILGAAHALTGNLEKALEICELAVRADPYLPIAHYNLGFVLANLQRYNEAKIEAEKALALDPNFKPAQGLLLQIERIENK